MEGPSPPERGATARCDDDRESVCDDFGVDGERRHQRICEDGYQRESVETCMFPVRVSTYITDGYTIIVAGRSRKGVDLYARPGSNPWRSQGGT